MNIKEILRLLPHRYPFLMVDRVLTMERSKRIVAIKNITINEPCFTGHFPAYPIMPGVLIVESIAQTAALLMLCEKQGEGGLYVIGMIKKMRFKESAYPGDQMQIEVNIVKLLSNSAIVEGTVTIGQKLIASGEMLFSKRKGAA